MIPLTEDEVRKIASSVCRYKPAGRRLFDLELHIRIELQPASGN